MRVLVDDLGYLALGHCLRATHAERAEDARRSQRGRLRPHRVRDRAGVPDLGGNGGTLGVHCVGERAQPGADVGTVEDDLMAVGRTRALTAQYATVVIPTPPAANRR